MKIADLLIVAITVPVRSFCNKLPVFLMKRTSEEMNAYFKNSDAIGS
jgi:hypothetical protein